MQKTWLLLLGLLMLRTSVEAQITITNYVFPVVGDTLHYAVDTMPSGIVMTAPGFGLEWDMSNLQPGYTWEEVYLDGATGADTASFPGATLRHKVDTSEMEVYLSSSSQNVAVMGYAPGSPYVLGLGIATQFNPDWIDRRAPMNFFDINADAVSYFHPFGKQLLPTFIITGTNPDSFRIRGSISSISSVDAFGTLKMPDTTYNVLRKKVVTYEERRLDGKIPPLGWLDVTDLARQYLNLDLGVDTTYTYHFMSDSSKEEIAICTTDKGALQVVRVQYKYVKPAPSTGIKTADLKMPSLSVFPNPAFDALNIRAEVQSGAAFSIKIFSIVGQEVWHKMPEGTSGILDEAVDISGLENGLYLLRVSSSQGETGQALFMKE